MRAKKDYGTVVAERVRDLKTLIEYFSVTRVMHCPEYENPCLPGCFSWDIFHARRLFYIQYIKHQIRRDRPNQVMFKRVRDIWNGTLGIPADLLDLVIGLYRGKRIPRNEIFCQVLEWKHVKGANKMWRGIPNSFDGFFVATNEQYWQSLLQNKEYATYETIPNASKRMKKILKKWEEGHR